MNAPDDSRSRPDREQVVETIGRARAGSESAYQWLQDRFHLALVGVVAEKTGWEHDHARQAVDEVWKEERTCLLREPGEGGYGATGRGSFHFYVWNHCIPWAKHYERNTRGGAVEGNDRIPLNPVKVFRDEHRWEPLAGPDGRPREVPVPPKDSAGRTAEEGASSEAMFVLLEVVFLPDIGYPHQQLSFGFSKLIYGRPSKGGGMYGDPTQTVEKHAVVDFAVLTADFASAYAGLIVLTPADEARIQDALEPLRARLPATVAEMVRGDGESEEQCAGFAGRPVGETRLEDYFAAWNGNGVTAVTNWSNRVKERVKRWLRARGPTPEGAGVER